MDQHRGSSEILNSHIAYDNLMAWWQLKAGTVVFPEFLAEWQVLWLPVVWVTWAEAPSKPLIALHEGQKSPWWVTPAVVGRIQQFWLLSGLLEKMPPNSF